jgi:bacteriorhodopsin
MPRWVWVAIGIAAVLLILWLLDVRFDLSMTGG